MVIVGRVVTLLEVAGAWFATFQAYSSDLLDDRFVQTSSLDTRLQIVEFNTPTLRFLTNMLRRDHHEYVAA
jgi:hypothetical protein